MKIPILPIQAFKDEHSPAVALLAIVLQKYGPECLECPPALLLNDIEKDYDITLSDLQLDKLEAAITILHSDIYETDEVVFEKVSHLLNNSYDLFYVRNPLEAEELTTALAHARIIVDGDEERLSFSDEVKAYAGIVFYDYGLCKPPVIFPEALMPISDCDSLEKDEALKELYDEKGKYIKDYLSRLQLP